MMSLDAATAEAVDVFRAQGIRTILLKGPVLTRWLYQHRLDRIYGDIDLLVCPDNFAEATRTLRSLGYRDLLQERRFGLSSGKTDSHAKHFRRYAGRRAEVDLHRGFVWSTMDPYATWRLLSEHTDTMIIGGTGVIVLAPTGLALVVALHAAQHGPAAAQREDLDRALRRFDETVWRHAASLAGQLRVEDAFAAGLRLSVNGQRLAKRLGLTESASVEVTLLASGNTLLALPMNQLRSERSLRRRIALLYGKLVPSAEYMRIGYPFARRGVLALVYSYFYRAVKLARLLPRARRALKAARRDAT